MDHLNEKNYESGDLPRLVSFIYRIRKPEELAQFPTGVDFEELLAVQHIRELTWIWSDDHLNLVGYAMLEPRFCNLYFEADPLPDASALQNEMVAWGLKTFGQLKAGGKIDRALALDTNCDEKDTARIDLLKSLGFIPQDLMTLHMTRSLEESIPTVKLPAGFSIRPVAGESEAEAVAAIYCAAYGNQNTHREDILTIMHTSSYERELDLVAVSPEGRLVGLCSCGFEDDLNEILPYKLGSTDPVLVHPDYQNLGLARALIWSGWEKLKARRIEVAELSTSSHNRKGIAAFTRAGYRIAARRLWLSHPVSI